MNAVEEFIESGEKPSTVFDCEQIMSSGKPEAQEGELHERLGDVERKLKICTEKYTQIEDKVLPKLKQEIQDQIQGHQQSIES